MYPLLKFSPAVQQSLLSLSKDLTEVAGSRDGLWAPGSTHPNPEEIHVGPVASPHLLPHPQLSNTEGTHSLSYCSKPWPPAVPQGKSNHPHLTARDTGAGRVSVRPCSSCPVSALTLCRQAALARAGSRRVSVGAALNPQPSTHFSLSQLESARHHPPSQGPEHTTYRSWMHDAIHSNKTEPWQPLKGS